MQEQLQKTDPVWKSAWKQEKKVKNGRQIRKNMRHPATDAKKAEEAMETSAKKGNTNTPDEP